LTDAAWCAIVWYHGELPKIFNNYLSFERDYWRRKSGLLPAKSKWVCWIGLQTAFDNLESFVARGGGFSRSSCSYAYDQSVVHAIDHNQHYKSKTPPMAGCTQK
jgi:hypothetical protein